MSSIIIEDNDSKDQDQVPRNELSSMDMDTNEIKEMDTNTLKMEINGQGSGIEWTKSCITKMKRELLNRLINKKNNKIKDDRSARIERKEVIKQTIYDDCIYVSSDVEEKTKSHEEHDKEEEEEEELELENEEELEEMDFWDYKNVERKRNKIAKYSSIEELQEKCEEYSNKILKWIESNEGIKKQPDNLRKDMKGYQLQGLNWMYTLLENLNFKGCILADEPGLGKTIQAISLLSQVRQTKGKDNSTHLIVATASTLSNWMREFNIWAPSFNIVLYYGTQHERFEIQQQILDEENPMVDVILTSYNLVKTKYDRSFFKQFNFKYLIIDEAQNIKNDKGQTYTKLKTIKRDKCLMLTGTVIQNNLYQIWSLLHFLDDNIFNDSTKKYFQGNNTNEWMEKIKTILHPFILRRLKSEVVSELPQKNEKTKYCHLTDVQKKLYFKLLKQSRTLYEKKSKSKHKRKYETSDSEYDDDQSSNKSIYTLLNTTLMKLRLIALR